MVIVKAKYELTLVGDAAEGAIEAWLQAEGEDKLKEYFFEYLSEKLVADRDYQGLDLLHVEAEWRPNNDKS